MAKLVKNNPILMMLLSSIVLSCASTLIVTKVGLNLLSRSLVEQLLMLFLLWFPMGIIFYLIISVLSARFNGFRALLTVDLTLNLVIRKTFLAIFIVFPMGLILYQHISEIIQLSTYGRSTDFTGWPPSGDVRFLFIIILTIILILIAFIMSSKSHTGNYLDSLADKYYVLFILCINILGRLPYIYLVNTQPVSDFLLIHQDAIRISQGTLPTQIYVSAHVFVTMIYGFLYRIFAPELIVIKFFHTVVYGLSGIFIFYTGKQILRSKLWAGISGLLLVSWPSLVIYSNVLTPEHLFILVECALIFTVSWFFKSHEINESKSLEEAPKKFVFLVLGLLFGILGMFRPFSELFLTAFAITLFAYNRGPKKTNMNIAGLFIIVVLFWFISKLPVSLANSYEHDFPNLRPCYLLVGMNIESSGRWNMEDYYICREIRLKTPDRSEYTKKVIGIVFERLQEKQDHLLPFLNKKFALLWQNSNGIIQWAVYSIEGGNSTFIINTVRNINIFDFALMFIGTMVCVIGTVIAFFKDIKPTIFFCLLSFFGFNLMELLLEVQTRYRTVAMPLFILFACWTFATIYSSIRPNNEAFSIVE